jgi:hypothetical protein
MSTEIKFVPKIFGHTGAPNPSIGTSVPARRLEPVTRHYRPQSAALDELVEVLLKLLVGAPTNCTQGDRA